MSTVNGVNYEKSRTFNSGGVGMGNLFVETWRATAKEVHDTAREKGWWDKERNDGEMIALMHSELSEALEAL